MATAEQIFDAFVDRISAALKKNGNDTEDELVHLLNDTGESDLTVRYGVSSLVYNNLPVDVRDADLAVQLAEQDPQSDIDTMRKALADARRRDARNNKK